MIPLPIHSYRDGSSARLVNVYAEKAPTQGRHPVLLRRAPGIESWATVGSGPIRGIHSCRLGTFVVSGDSLYILSAGGTATFLGNIPGTERVSMDDNGLALVIVATPHAYFWSGSFGQITDGDFTSRGASSVAFIDNYLVFTEPGSGRFFSTGLADLEFDGLDFATAEGAPDDLLGLIVDHRQIFLAGTDSCELWDNVGGSGFPFARSPNGFVEIGCAAGATLAKADNSVFWLANDGTVRRLDGITPARISQHGVEQAIRGYTQSAAYAWTYALDGHLCYVLTFPQGTWVYDITSGEWHERRTYQQDNWQIVGAAYAFGNWLVCSTGNKVGRLTPNAFDEFGIAQPASWTYSTLYQGHQKLRHVFLQLDITVGEGTIGREPYVELEFSDDDGQTWQFLPKRALGTIGQRRKLVHWHRLGSAYERVYRCTVADAVPFTVLDSQIRVI